MAAHGDRAPDPAELRLKLLRLAEQYPDGLQEAERASVDRVAFQFERVFRPGIRLADLGGGIGLFPVACAALGLEVWLVDDFADPVNEAFTLEAIGLHEQLGVHVLRSDVFDWGRHFADRSLDVVSCFFSFEHWDRGARPVFKEATRILRPGGTMILGALNAFGWRTRLTTLLGVRNPKHFWDRYRLERFRGLRYQASVTDLRRIAEDIGLTDVRIDGRNWGAHNTRIPQALHHALDRALRLSPALCTFIYLEGRVPETP